MSRPASQDQFLRVSLRHLAALRDTDQGSDGTFSDGFFDIPDQKLSDLGAMFFLVSLSKYHMHRPLAQVFASLDAPLRLSQYRIFRSGGHPRAFVTWAGLDRPAETHFSVNHRPLRMEQWNSGNSLWVVDLAAPFGHIEQVIRMLAQNRKTNRVRTLWHNKPGTRARVIEWSRPSADHEISVTSYGQSQFAKLLEREG